MMPEWFSGADAFIDVSDTSPKQDTGFIREGIPVKFRPEKER
jgi:hypothetical protein